MAPVARPIEQRLWDLIMPEPNSGCWYFMGALNKSGYGRFCPSRKTQTLSAHRVSYELFKGPIPAGLHLDHLCRTPCCINPDHLEPVTHAENMRRWQQTVTHCPRGHPYSGTNLLMYDGSRTCRACKNAASRKSYHATKGPVRPYRRRPVERQADSRDQERG